MNRRKFIAKASIAGAIFSVPLITNLLSNKNKEALGELKVLFPLAITSQLPLSVVAKYKVTDGVEVSNKIALYPLCNKDAFILVEGNDIKEIDTKQIKTYTRFLIELQQNIQEVDTKDAINVSEVYAPVKTKEAKSGLNHFWSFENSLGNTITVTSKFMKSSHVKVS